MEERMVGKGLDYRLVLAESHGTEHIYDLLLVPRSGLQKEWWKAKLQGKEVLSCVLLTLVLPEEVPWLLEGFRELASRLPRGTTYAALAGQKHTMASLQKRKLREALSLFLHPPTQRALTPLEHLCLLLLGMELLLFNAECSLTSKSFLQENINWDLPWLEALPKRFFLSSRQEDPLFYGIVSEEMDLAPRASLGFLLPLLLEDGYRKATPEEAAFLRQFFFDTGSLPLYILGIPTVRRAWSSMANAALLYTLRVLPLLPPPPQGEVCPLSLLAWWQALPPTIQKRMFPVSIIFEHLPWEPSPVFPEGSLGGRLLTFPTTDELLPIFQRLQNSFSQWHRSSPTVPPTLRASVLVEARATRQEVLSVVQAFHPLSGREKGKVASVITSFGYNFYVYKLLQALVPLRDELSAHEVRELLLRLPREVSTDYLSVLFPEGVAEEVFQRFILEGKPSDLPFIEGDELVLFSLLQAHYGPLAIARFLLSWAPGTEALTYGEVQGLIALNDESYLTLPPSWWRSLATATVDEEEATL